MSQSGWGGQGPSSQDGSSQQGWGQQPGRQNPQGQQGWSQQPGQQAQGQQPGQQGGWGPAPQQPSPQQPPTWGQPSPGGAPQGGPYGGSPAYGAPQPPTPPRKKWPLILVAIGCVLALFLGIGIITATVLLNRSGGGDDPTAAPTTSGSPTEEPTTEATTEAPTVSGSSEGAAFEPADPYGESLKTPDEIWSILEDNPMTSGTVSTIGSCELPGTPKEPSDEQLQATLDAAGGCLSSVWSTASSDRELPWSNRSLVVYQHPDVPSSAVCEPDTFDAETPRVCNIDATIYWPSGSGIAHEMGASGAVGDEAELSTAYLWDLSYSYVNAGWWDSTIGVYYSQMSQGLEDDPDRQAEAKRRYASQNICVASLMSMRVPTAAQPSETVRGILSDPKTWQDGPAVTAETHARWIKKGLEADGDLAACNAWKAPLDEVA